LVGLVVDVFVFPVVCPTGVYCNCLICLWC
jgi:hypothetical protein